MLIEINCEKLSTKKALMSYFQEKIKGIYALNYDALYDALTYYKSNIQITIINQTCYEDLNNLEETLTLICQNNKYIRLVWNTESNMNIL